MRLPLQAVEADRKDDRDIVCEEVFTDLTGGLDDFLKGQTTAGMTDVCTRAGLVHPTGSYFHVLYIEAHLLGCRSASATSRAELQIL